MKPEPNAELNVKEPHVGRSKGQSACHSVVWTPARFLEGFYTRVNVRSIDLVYFYSGENEHPPCETHVKGQLGLSCMVGRRRMSGLDKTSRPSSSSFAPHSHTQGPWALLFQLQGI